ncbi:MAG: outer membrane beta-barrel protein [Deltaproteobacteria bacterium]|nr:outer membrane beta-barrel protein [Deltaproteobacteria bacterium]
MRRIGLVLLLVLVAPIAARAARDEGFSFDVTPYLWLASVGGDFGVPGGGSTLSVSGRGSLFDSDTSLSAGFMLKAEARYGDFGLLLDGAWARLSTDASGREVLFASASADTDLGFATAALTWRLPIDDPLLVRGFVGARIFFADIQLHFEPGVLPEADPSGDDTWADPVLGAVVRYSFTDAFYASVLGDVGGFDVSSRITWQVYGGLGYELADWLAASVGYRYLVDDYENDGFLLDMSLQGFLVGASFRF